jgi:4-hydroxybenzoate polyprenyltransferase
MVGTMILTRKFLLETFVQLRRLELAYPDLQFALVALSTALMAAGGYIVNDIFDQEADNINKPKRLIAGSVFSVNSCWALYWLHTIPGLFIGLYLALHIGIYQLMVVPFLIVGLLWFYTTTYKKMPLIGNIVISLFTGFVPLVVGYFELLSERKTFQMELFDIRYVWGYAVFAFLISMVREILKDLEDMDGDRNSDCQTMPVVWGVLISKGFALLFLTLLLSGLAWLEYLQYTNLDYVSFGYFLGAVSFPSVLLLIWIVRAKFKSGFRMASHLSKFIMLTGISSMVVFWYTLQPYLKPIPKPNAEPLPQVELKLGNPQ